MLLYGYLESLTVKNFNYACEISSRTFKSQYNWIITEVTIKICHANTKIF